MIGIDCRLINKIQNTGISRYTIFLIEYYANRFGGKNIVLVTNDKFFKWGDCVIIHTKLKPFNILDFLKFSKLISNTGIKLFHVPFYSGFFEKKSTVKVIVTVHDLMYRFVDGFFGKNKFLSLLKIKYFDFIVKTSLNNADKIVSVSVTTKRDVLEIFGCESLHVPEDSALDGQDDFTILDKYNLENKRFYFYCGNNRPHKNLNFIINFFKKNPQLPPLVLAGKGHKNQENIIATGIVSDEELKALYKSAIAFVFPSNYEGFGLPVLEAIRSETFVIASKISAFLEFKTRNVLFFELGNEKELLEAIRVTLSNDFVPDEEFLECYNKERIYKLSDSIIDGLLN